MTPPSHGSPRTPLLDPQASEVLQQRSQGELLLAGLLLQLSQACREREAGASDRQQGSSGSKGTLQTRRTGDAAAGRVWLGSSRTSAAPTVPQLRPAPNAVGGRQPTEPLASATCRWHAAGPTVESEPQVKVGGPWGAQEEQQRGNRFHCALQAQRSASALPGTGHTLALRPATATASGSGAGLARQQGPQRWSSVPPSAADAHRAAVEPQPHQTCEPTQQAVQDLLRRRAAHKLRDWALSQHQSRQRLQQQQEQQWRHQDYVQPTLRHVEAGASWYPGSAGQLHSRASAAAGCVVPTQPRSAAWAPLVLPGGRRQQQQQQEILQLLQGLIAVNSLHQG